MNVILFPLARFEVVNFPTFDKRESVYPYHKDVSFWNLGVMGRNFSLILPPYINLEFIFLSWSS
jgi:hypothetical protein